MKKIGFIGAYDKTDLIIYIAKILTTLKKKVLVIDATTKQKARYVVPVINPTKMYVTEYDLDYDIVLIDTDSIEGFSIFKLEESFKNYFVTSFDAYSLKKGLEILSELKTVVSLTKVLFAEEMLKEEDDYLNFLSLGYKIIWNEYRIYFPIENGDLSVIYENQRVAKIKFKKLSIQYKDGLAYMSEEILGDVSEMTIRRAIKLIEKGV